MTLTWPPKGLTRAVRDRVGKSGWSAWSGTLSRIEDGVAFHVYEFARRATLQAKPVAWNEIVWNALDVTFTRKPAPSMHFRGVHAPVPAIDVHWIKSSSAPEVADELCTFADDAIKRLDPSWVSDFPAQLRQAAVDIRPHDYLVTEVAWHLSNNRRDQAQALCKEVVAKSRPASFVVASASADGARRTFFEAVLHKIDHDTL